MNKCPRCENETIKEDGRYCPICILDLERLKIVRKLEELKEDHTKLDLDVKGLEHRIEKLKRTAQEVPVQEQFLTQIFTNSKTIQQLSQIQLRTIMIEALLGNELTIFVKEKEPNLYEVEVADSNKRVKLLTMNLDKLSKSRYSLLDYQSF